MYNNCNHTDDCSCHDCQPVNCLEQAINDVLATKDTQLKGYVESARESAEDAQVSADAAKGSENQAKEYRDESELAAATATQALVVISDTASILESTADALETSVAGIAVKFWHYTTEFENQQVIRIPDAENAISVQYINIEGGNQYPSTPSNVRGFTFNKDTLEVTLVEPVPAGVEITFVLGSYNMDNPQDFAQLLFSTDGAKYVKTASNMTVQQEIDKLNLNYSDLRTALLPAMTRILAEADFTLVGTFESGTTLNLPNDVVLFMSEGKAYKWVGTLPKTVAANTTPDTTGSDWVDITQVTLHSLLQADQGAGVIGYKVPSADAVKRSLFTRLQDTVSVKDFGAKGDGITDDTVAIQAAFDTGRDIYIPIGVYVCTTEIEIKTHGQRIYGAGRGYGYNANTERYSPDGQVAQYSSAVFNWTHVSTLLFKGTGTKRVRTRINYRASVADPQDTPMSVCLNIQAEGTQLENFCVFLDITPPAGGPSGELTDSIDNLGADWDVGIFIGCRANTKLKDVASIGYHRKANIWFDVTQGLNLPRFNSYRGGSYPQGPVENGADGCTLDGVYTSGGLWGVNVQGAKPKSGESTYTTQYYDDLLGAAVDDTRGSWGFSDFLMVNCQIFGANHHTRRRLVDMKASPNAINDWDVGGAFSIDGLTSNPSNGIHGHRYIDCRFQSWAPFCFRIDRSARDTFVGCMIENPATFVKTRAGAPIVLGPDTTFYGLCATANHNFLYIVESQVPYSVTYTTMKWGDLYLANSSAANRHSRIPYNELRVISESQAATATGRVLLGYPGNESEVAIQRTTTGSVSLRSSNALVFSNGTDNLFSVSSLGSAQTKAAVACMTDNTSSCGLPAQRWTNVYAASGSINTSDEETKTDIEPIPELVFKAWEKVEFMQYRFKDAIQLKGDGAARLHFGVIAQRVKDAFESEGLDPFAYGLLCYDEWDDKYEPVMGLREIVIEGETYEEEYDTGETRLVIAAGSRYGIRYEEALALECAFLRWKLSKAF